VRLLVFTLVGVGVLAAFRIDPTPSHAGAFFGALLTAMVLTEKP
jgi:hypothetical protein